MRSGCRDLEGGDLNTRPLVPKADCGLNENSSVFKFSRAKYSWLPDWNSRILLEYLDALIAATNSTINSIDVLIWGLNVQRAWLVFQ